MIPNLELLLLGAHLYLYNSTTPLEARLPAAASSYLNGKTHSVVSRTSSPFIRVYVYTFVPSTSMDVRASVFMYAAVARINNSLIMLPLRAPHARHEN